MIQAIQVLRFHLLELEKVCLCLCLSTASDVTVYGSTFAGYTVHVYT